LAGVCAGFVVTGGMLRAFADKLLVIDGRIMEPVAAIVALNGSQARVWEAADLFRQRWAPQVWLTQDPRSFSEHGPATGCDGHENVHDIGRRSDVRALTSRGVPCSAIVVFEEPARGTEAEIRQIAVEARRRGVRSLILATSNYHSRRVGILWCALGGDAPKAVVTSASGGQFQTMTWFEWIAIVPREYAAIGWAMVRGARRLCR
jgi:uncharacterized SAM-binding protein YcdF (DUF218 family)